MDATPAEAEDDSAMPPAPAPNHRDMADDDMTSAFSYDIEKLQVMKAKTMYLGSYMVQEISFSFFYTGDL